jgi:hypothetical protein
VQKTENYTVGNAGWPEGKGRTGREERVRKEKGRGQRGRGGGNPMGSIM